MGRIVLVGVEPAHIGYHHHVANGRIGAKVQVGRQVAALEGPDVVDVPEREQHRVGIVGAVHIDEAGQVTLHSLHPGWLEVMLHRHKAVAVDPSHAVVASDDEVDLSGAGRGLNAGPQSREQRVELLHGQACGPAHGPVAVTAVVGLLKVAHHQARALASGQREQAHHLVDPLGRSEQGLAHVVVPVGGMLALDGHIAAHPVHSGRDEALALGREPNGVAAIVAGIGALHAVGQGIAAACDGRQETIGHNAVVVGIEPRGQGVVVGEGLARKRGAHHRLHAAASHGVEKRGVESLAVVPAEAVERHYHSVARRAGRPRCQHGGSDEDEE